MGLTGKAKKEYQREYMKRKRSNKVCSNEESSLARVVVPSFPLTVALNNKNKVLPAMGEEQYRAAMFNCNLALVYRSNRNHKADKERIDKYNKAHNELGGYLAPTQSELNGQGVT